MTVEGWLLTTLQAGQRLGHVGSKRRNNAVRPLYGKSTSQQDKAESTTKRMQNAQRQLSCFGFLQETWQGLPALFKEAQWEHKASLKSAGRLAGAVCCGSRPQGLSPLWRQVEVSQCAPGQIWGWACPSAKQLGCALGPTPAQPHCAGLPPLSQTYSLHCKDLSPVCLAALLFGSVLRRLSFTGTKTTHGVSTRA